MRQALRDATMARRLQRRVRRAQNPPDNTCPASRHVQMIGDALARGRRYAMIEEEPEHVAISLLSVVAALFETHSALAAFLAMDERSDDDGIPWREVNAVRRRARRALGLPARGGA